MIESGGDSSSFVLTYPNAQALQNHVFLGYSIGDLEWKQRDDLMVVDNFRLFILHYMVDLSLPSSENIKTDFEFQLRNLMERLSFESADLNYALLSRARELEEQSKITFEAIPYLGLTGCILTTFLVVTLFNLPLYKSQYVEAIFAVISPGMALLSCGGFLSGLGLPFSNVIIGKFLTNCLLYFELFQLYHFLRLPSVSMTLFW